MVGNYGHRAERMGHGAKGWAHGVRLKAHGTGYKVSGGSAAAGRERPVKSNEKLMNIE